MATRAAATDDPVQMHEKKVNLFIAGAQKGGTTALHRKLRPHPEIFRPGKKELHFFDHEGFDWTDPPYDKLHEHFDFTQGPIFGEATPIYIYWPKAMDRLQAYNPAARIIVILRHPAFRALSAWKMEKARGRERLSFALAVSWVGRLRVRASPRGSARWFSYVERGHYAPQIRRLLNLFPRDQVLFLTSDQPWHDESGTLEKICRFLDVSPAPVRPEANAQKYVVPVDTRHIPDQAGAVTDRLSRKFRSDIAETARLTGLDLDAWRDPAYREPMGG
jgi:hypothetical protein